jgi:hypothetical protein
MIIQGGQIYYAKKAVLGRSTYARPLLVLRVNSDSALVTPLSTQFELCEHGDIALNGTAEEFKKTGLKKESYAMADREFKVTLGFLKDADYLVTISGSIKKRVEDWWGEELK